MDLYTNKDTAPHLISNGRKVYVCTEAGIRDAGALAKSLWGPGVLLGYPGETPQERTDWFAHVGYVAARRTGPVMPVYAVKK